MASDKGKGMEDRILSYIAAKIRADGFAPSVRDIQTALGIRSTSTVHTYLRRLEEQGRIHKEQNKSRALRLDTPAAESSPQRRTTVHIPLVGRVAAGVPILAEENLEGYIDYPLLTGTYDPNRFFALRVRGESMIEAGILDGDVIVVRKESSAQNGQIVVALVGEEATVKTFYRENGHFRLQPENKTMEPIITNEVMVLGRVVSSIRFYK